MIKINGDCQSSRWRIYDSAKARKCAVARFIQLGYKYLVGWKDIQGFGLEAVPRAAWQDDKSVVYCNMRH